VTLVGQLLSRGSLVRVQPGLPNSVNPVCSFHLEHGPSDCRSQAKNSEASGLPIPLKPSQPSLHRNPWRYRPPRSPDRASG
jgi:hypothetical protein